MMTPELRYVTSYCKGQYSKNSSGYGQKILLNGEYSKKWLTLPSEYAIFSSISWEK
jgi:hypothetical protein